MTAFTTEHTRALELLSGCPDGATDYALTTLHRIAPHVLYDLIQSGRASVARHTVGTTALRYTVHRLRITDTGRAAIVAASPDAPRSGRSGARALRAAPPIGGVS